MWCICSNKCLQNNMSSTLKAKKIKAHSYLFKLYGRPYTKYVNGDRSGQGRFPQAIARLSNAIRGADDTDIKFLLNVAAGVERVGINGAAALVTRKMDEGDEGGYDKMPQTLEVRGDPTVRGEIAVTGKASIEQSEREMQLIIEERIRAQVEKKLEAAVNAALEEQERVHQAEMEEQRLRHEAEIKKLQRPSGGDDTSKTINLFEYQYQQEKRKNERLERENRVREKDNKRLTNENEQLQEENVRLQEENKQLQSEMRELQGENNQLRTLQRKMKKQIMELSTLNEQLIGEITIISEAATFLNEGIEAGKRAVEKAKQLAQEQKNCKEELAVLKTQLDQCGERAEDLRRSLKECNERGQESERTIKELQNELKKSRPQPKQVDEFTLRPATVAGLKKGDLIENQKGTIFRKITKLPGSGNSFKSKGVARFDGRKFGTTKQVSYPSKNEIGDWLISTQERLDAKKSEVKKKKKQLQGLSPEVQADLIRAAESEVSEDDDFVDSRSTPRQSEVSEEESKDDQPSSVAETPETPEKPTLLGKTLTKNNIKDVYSVTRVQSNNEVVEYDNVKLAKGGKWAGTKKGSNAKQKQSFKFKSTDMITGTRKNLTARIEAFEGIDGLVPALPAVRIPERHEMM